MSTVDPDKFLAAVLAKDFHAADYQVRSGRRDPSKALITVSRDYAAGGEVIAASLANHFGVPLYNRELLVRVANLAGLDLSELRKHDEHPAAYCTSFLNQLFTHETSQLDRYRRALGTAVFDIASEGGVIVGRGAHLLLRVSQAFRLRIVGSNAVCGHRLAAERSISLAQAVNEIERINSERRESVQQVFGSLLPDSDLDHATNFDLIVNTDRTQIEQVSKIVIFAIENMGMDRVNPTL